MKRREITRPRATGHHLLAIAIAACSGGTPHAVEDARSAAIGSGSAATSAALAAAPAPISHGPYRADPGDFANGDVQVRVEWKGVPTVARASSGRTSCGTASAPAVAPTTTWGIPDAIVAIDVDHGKPAAEPDARVVLEHCAVSPRVVLAGTSIVVASAADAPAQLALSRAGDARSFAAVALPAFGSGAIPIELPIAGHSVDVPLASSMPGATGAAPSGSLYALAGSAAEPAWIVVPPQPYYAITEASGQVVLRDVPVGTFTVKALLPARGGQPARAGHATVTVAANALAEVTVELAP